MLPQLLELNLVQHRRIFKATKADHVNVVRPKGIERYLIKVIAGGANRIPYTIFTARPPEPGRLAIAHALNNMGTDKCLRLMPMGTALNGGNLIDLSHVRFGSTGQQRVLATAHPK